MDTLPPIIKTDGLTRDYKHTHAVANLSLDIMPGELFGLVGPDGAGKTTTLRLLAGLLDITSGSASVAGLDLRDQAEDIKPNIGYMAQQFNLYGELSVVENLTFFSELYSLTKSELGERMERLLSFAGLSEFKSRRAAHLSGGMQKKLALTCSLIHQPRLLLLDEPTTGVDPVSRREFWDILTELHLGGTTIVVSTPYMDEADRCSTVGLMHNGRMVVCAPPGEIRAMVPGEILEVTPSNWQAAFELLNNLEGILEIQTYGNQLHVLVDSAPKRLPIIEEIFAQGKVSHTGIRTIAPRMEEAFISLISGMED
jgi:ABC-2 type transport system ATP-binding protein